MADALLSMIGYQQQTRAPLAVAPHLNSSLTLR